MMNMKVNKLTMLDMDKTNLTLVASNIEFFIDV